MKGINLDPRPSIRNPKSISPSRYGRKDAENVSGMEDVFETPMQTVDQSNHGNGSRYLELLQSLTDSAPFF
jgi:hypothetical protein